MSAKPVKKRSHWLIVAGAVVTVVALGLIGYAVYGTWQWYSTTQQPKPVTPHRAVTVSTSHPDETPPKTCTTYKAEAKEPRSIQIPSIGVDGCIQKVGVDQNHAIAAPNNVHLAGWYTESVLPGEQGVSLIDGHVQGRYGPAIFGKLHKLVTGDSIRIENGDGSWQLFSVVDTQSYSIQKTESHLFEKLPDVQEQLTLITCSGTYDKKTASYSQRILVRAALVHE